MMHRLTRRLKRLFYRPGRKAGLAYYVRLSHKLAKRLGVARFRARNAEAEVERLLAIYDKNVKQLQGDILMLRDANADLDQRVREYEAAEAAAKKAREALLKPNLQQLPRTPYPPGVRL